MAHDCPACGMTCYCDGDDTWMESEWTLAHCEHDCDPEEDDLDYGSEDDADRFGTCPATRGAFNCTLPPGHEGDHIAQGAPGQECERWPRFGSVPVPTQVGGEVCGVCRGYGRVVTKDGPRDCPGKDCSNGRIRPPAARGDETAPAAPPGACATCEGQGMVLVLRDAFPGIRNRICDDCNGTGRAPSGPPAPGSGGEA